ncbi:MAG: Clp protease N-terminal domain-containing protein [Phycisphaerae bacterium]
MFEQFTDHARRALQLEGMEATRMHHSYLGTEHLLLGLLREPEGHGHRAMQALGLDLRHVRAAVKKVAQKGEGTAVPGSIHQTDHFKHVMRVAVDEARALNAGQVGTEHLMLALLQETDGVAIKALERLHVKPQDVRDEIIRMLEEEGRA